MSTGLRGRASPQFGAGQHADCGNCCSTERSFELHEADRIGPPSDHPKYLGNPRKSNLFGESGPEPENDLVGIGEAVQTADYKVSIYILRASSSLSALTRLPFNVFPERLLHFPPALKIVERSERAKAKVIA